MLKYSLAGVTKNQRERICKKLNLSERTFYRKARALVEEKNGFEYFELLKISLLLDVPMESLVNKEAIKSINGN